MKQTAILSMFCLLGCSMEARNSPAPASPREVVSLDGAWQIVFDSRNEGRAGHWYKQETFDALPNRRTIQVPNCWETIEKDYEGAGWYALRFQVPASWKDKVVRLKFGAVNYRAEVWVNEQPAGFHDGGYTPFELVISDLLRPGAENVLSVRVLGPVITKDSVLDGIGPNETPHWRGAIAGGIWQSVQLIATDRAYFSDVFVQPDLRGSRAKISAEVENAGDRTLAAMVEFTLAGEKGNVRRQVSLRPGHNRIEAEIPIPNPKLWTPATPSLYTLQSRLSVGDGKTDQVTERFGMREFTVRDGNYNLNGKKILIKASFWEGFYPNTLAFPPNRDIVRREVLLAKEAGFNVLRLWRKPPVPMILDVADEMGIMIIDAPPIECMDFWPQLAPETEHRIAIEVSELVHRDRNHPSVICWEVFNEVARSGIARLKQTMSLLARDTDPTRIVVDESGGWAGGAHAYLPYSYESQPINEIHSYRPSPVDPQTYQSYLGLGRPGFDTSSLAQSRSKMRAPDGIIFISEVGYGGLPDLPANVAQYQREGNPLTPDYRSHVSLLAGIGKAMSEMKWSEIFPDVSALCRASQRVQAEGNRLQLEALRLNPRINGYCVHAFTDGDWVLGAGLLDQFRNPKLTYESIKKVQTPLYVAVRVNPSNVREGEKGTLLIDSVNDRAPARGRIEWEIVGPGDRVLLHDSKTVTIGAGVTNLLEAPLPALAVSGTHIARVRFVPESGAPFENQRDFFYLAKKDLAAPDVAFALDDPKHEITPFLEARGIRYRQFSGNESDLPPVVVATDAPKDGAALLAYIARGGVAVFLKPPAIPFEASGSAATKPANKWLGDGGFPLKLWYAAARGNWVPVNHGIRKHPIFDGLPSSDFMGQVYLNVCANQTLVGANVPPIVGSLSIKIDNHSIDRNYLGLNEVWWGADLAAVPHGKGQMLLSTLRLKENLKTDPVAEKLLYNMIRWASSVAGR